MGTAPQRFAHASSVPGAMPTLADPPDLMRMVSKGGPLLWPRGRAELALITESIGVPEVHSLNQWL